MEYLQAPFDIFGCYRQVFVENFASEHHKKLVRLKQSCRIMTQVSGDKQSFSIVIREMKKQLVAFDKQDDIYRSLSAGEIERNTTDFLILID